MLMGDFMIDGVLHTACPKCNGTGETRCRCCGQPDGECPTCKGTAMIPKESEETIK